MTDHGGAGSPEQWARACWAAFEPFALSRLTRPEAGAICEAAGLPSRAAVLVLRAAPLGRAAPAVVGAALHGFSDAMIGGYFPAAWSVTGPEETVTATHTAVDAACAERYADLTDRAAAVADLLAPALRGLDVSGRPLAAANAAIAPPPGVWARLWRQLTTLREHRGDGHVAVLTAAAVDRIEAQVLMAGWGAEHVDVHMLRASRHLDDDLWSAAVARLADRGYAEVDGRLTARGRQLREDIELRTDEAAARPYRELGNGVRELFGLAAELSRRTLENGEFMAVTAVGAPWPARPPAAV